MSTVKVAYDIGRSNREPIDADYIVSEDISKTDISNYITSLDVAHNGMQLYFEDLDLGVIITDESTGEYVELGGGGVAIVADNAEESELLSNLQTTGSLENGQIIYNQNEDKYKKYFDGSLIESSGQIITELERQRLIPNIVKLDSGNNPFTPDDGDQLLDWSTQDFIDNFGSIVTIDGNDLGFSEDIRVDLPDDTMPEGWHIFFIVTTGNQSLKYRTNTATLLPFNADAVPGFLNAIYNVSTGSANIYSITGNIFEG